MDSCCIVDYQMPSLSPSLLCLLPRFLILSFSVPFLFICGFLSSSSHPLSHTAVCVISCNLLISFAFTLSHLISSYISHIISSHLISIHLSIHLQFDNVNVTGVTMWRSSQPKCGVSGACAADEKLLDLIAQSCVFKRTPTGTVKATGDPLLCIIDCRPKVMSVCEGFGVDVWR